MWHRPAERNARWYPLQVGFSAVETKTRCKTEDCRMSIEGEVMCLMSNGRQRATKISYTGHWRGTVDDRAGLGGWPGVGAHETGKFMSNSGIIRSLLHAGLCFSYTSRGLVHRYVPEIRSFQGAKVQRMLSDMPPKKTCPPCGSQRNKHHRTKTCKSIITRVSVDKHVGTLKVYLI